VSRIIGRDGKATVCWMTLGRHEASPSLSSAPLSVAELLKAGLFGSKESVVLTSATLTTDDSFAYIKERLGVEDARELSLGSPFDYRTSTLILTPTDMPEPDNQAYAAAVQSALIDLVQASEGRALVLFTSHSALRTAYNGIKRPLEEQQILASARYRWRAEAPARHAEGEPAYGRTRRGELLGGRRRHRRGAVAARDRAAAVPGAERPGVPGAVGTVEQPFERYAVPQAILRFKQGFGRLIRGRQDRGVTRRARPPAAQPPLRRDVRALAA
jgi:DNA polymerase-3 subunit epsilon/ATP-dependent DNA helicase DinG